MRFVLRVLITAVAIGLTAALLSGLTIVGGSTPLERAAVVAGVGLVFGLVNAIVKPVVAFFALPLYVLTLGLFALVVNALMLMLTAWFTELSSWGLRVDGFGTAVVAALLISLVTVVLSAVTGVNRDR